MIVFAGDTSLQFRNGVAASPVPESTSDGGARGSQYDSAVTIRLMDDGELCTLSLDAYLRGVTAAEMPAAFEVEALKAQAVAARTYTLYKMAAGPSENHPDADVCADINCCKAYCTETELREKWGAQYDACAAKIAAAVAETDGQYLTYDGAPILAVFHSASAGFTEASENVWSNALPYLVGVSSPETAETVPTYVSGVTVAHDDFAATVQAAYPEADLSGTPETWISEIVRSDSGRILTVQIGGVLLKGTELRTLFDLRSTAAELQVTDTDVEFTTTGYGHGVGMSQYGANVLAGNGYGCREILNWYYPGTEWALLGTAAA